jgi:hypothetical protein
MKIETIMRPDHPRWLEFCEMLAGPTGCNFRKEGMAWNCGGDHRFARRLLPQFGVDVEKSIAYFEENGGYCDCEILFNCTEAEDEA